MQRSPPKINCFQRDNAILITVRKEIETILRRVKFELHDNKTLHLHTEIDVTYLEELIPLSNNSKITLLGEIF